MDSSLVIGKKNHKCMCNNKVTGCQTKVYKAMLQTPSQVQLVMMSVIKSTKNIFAFWVLPEGVGILGGIPSFQQDTSVPLTCTSKLLYPDACLFVYTDLCDEYTRQHHHLGISSVYCVFSCTTITVNMRLCSVKITYSMNLVLNILAILNTQHSVT